MWQGADAVLVTPGKLSEVTDRYLSIFAHW
jgi:hypothetical protein